LKTFSSTLCKRSTSDISPRLSPVASRRVVVVAAKTETVTPRRARSTHPIAPPRRESTSIMSTAPDAAADAPTTTAAVAEAAPTSLGHRVAAVRQRDVFGSYVVAAAAMRCFGSRNAVKFPGRWRLRREIEREVRARAPCRRKDVLCVSARDDDETDEDDARAGPLARHDAATHAARRRRARGRERRASGSKFWVFCTRGGVG